MKENQKVKKISFFKKVWYSITKFEQYPTMAIEGFKSAIKYLLMLTAIVTVFVMIGSLLQVKTLVGDLANYVENEIPEFSYKEGILYMEIEEAMIIDNIQYDGIDKIIINTLTQTNQEKEQIENDNLVEGNTIFFFKDEIVLKSESENGEALRQSYTYYDFVTSYTGQYIDKFDKIDFLEYLRTDKMNTFYLSYAITAFVYLFIVNVIVALLDAFEIAILGWITTTIAKIRMKFGVIYNMAIYSLTLPMILNILYMVINYFTNFTITYFQVAYITIAYIYLAATIFILKDDFIKKMQEVEKIKEEQIKVREEIQQREEEKPEQDEKGSLEDGQG